MIPKNWHYKTLKEIASANGLQIGPFGSQLKASEYVDDPDGIPVVMPKDMIDGYIHGRTIARVSRQKAEQMKRHYLKTDDIIFGRRGDIGRCSIVTKREEGWLCGSGCLRVRFSDAVYPKFISYQIQQSATIQWLESNAVGQTMLNLNTTILGETPIVVPPIEEQKKIAEILGTWDEAIGTIEKNIVLKNQKKLFVFREFFGSSKSKLQKMKAQKFGEFLIKIGSGITPRGGSSVYLSQGIPLIRSQNVRDGYLDLTDVVFIGNSQHQIMSNSQVLPNDVLLNITGASIGRSCVFPENIGEANVNQHVCILRCSTSVNPHYLSSFLNSELGWKFVSSYQAGGNREGLNYQQISSFKIELPSIEDQSKFADILINLEHEIKLFEQIRQSLVLQKQGLMQQLLTGKLRVKTGRAK